MKISKLYSWKISNSTSDLRSESYKGRSRGSHCHSHWKSRENPTDSLSAQEAKPGPKAYSCTRAGTIPTLQNIALHYGPSETDHWGIFYLWTCRILWATGYNCTHSQYKWLLEACTNGNFACSVWAMTHFYSQRSGTAGKTTDPFLLGTLESTTEYLWAFCFSFPWVPLPLKHTD